MEEIEKKWPSRVSNGGDWKEMTKQSIEWRRLKRNDQAEYRAEEMENDQAEYRAEEMEND